PWLWPGPSPCARAGPAAAAPAPSARAAARAGTRTVRAPRGREWGAGLVDTGGSSSSVTGGRREVPGHRTHVRPRTEGPGTPTGPADVGGRWEPEVWTPRRPDPSAPTRTASPAGWTPSSP